MNKKALLLIPLVSFIFLSFSAVSVSAQTWTTVETWNNRLDNGAELNISINGSGSTTPSSGTHYYTWGTSVSLDGLPDSGWYFSHWSGETGSISDTSSSSTSITMDGDYSIAANFEEKTWTTVETWNNDIGGIGWSTVEIWNDNMETKGWTTVEQWNVEVYGSENIWRTAEQWNTEVGSGGWKGVENWSVKVYGSGQWIGVENWGVDLEGIEWTSAENWTNKLDGIYFYKTVEEWKNEINPIGPKDEPIIPWDDLVEFVLIPLIVVFIPSFILMDDFGTGGLLMGLILGIILLYFMTDIGLGLIILMFGAVIILWRYL